MQNDGRDSLGELGSQAQEERRNRSVRSRQQRHDSALCHVLDHALGRALVWAILERARVFHLSHTAGDPYLTAFGEGRRDIGLWLLADVMRLRPQAYARISEEAQAPPLAADRRPSEFEKGDFDKKDPSK